MQYVPLGHLSPQRYIDPNPRITGPRASVVNLFRVISEDQDALFLEADKAADCTVLWIGSFWFLPLTWRVVSV